MFLRRSLPAGLTMIIAMGLLPAVVYGQTAQDYPYPIKDPYFATVVRTPEPLRADLPPVSELPLKLRTITVLPDRSVPDVFWWQREMHYGVVPAGRGPAPLAFVIAGTGGGFDGPLVKVMARAFHQAGVHVIMLSSPTFSNFVVTGSELAVPGMPLDDARDLYRAMRQIYETEKEHLKVTDFYVTGYSLGGMNTAYLAYLDEQEKYFNFRKALVINPPVSLFNSVQILDYLVTEVFPTRDDFREFYEMLMQRISTVYRENVQLQLNEEFLFALAKEFPFTQDDMKGLIGLSFRFSATNMIFSSDMMTRWGYLVPQDADVNRHSRIGIYFRTGNIRSSFTQYFRDYLLPVYQAREPGVTEDELRSRATLFRIEEFLRRAAHVGVMGNDDDIILGPGEVDYLKDVFGSRGTFFPHGGHLGNLEERIFLARAMAFFTAEGWQ
jgi:predicted alpha/beta-fold hydrolase